MKRFGYIALGAGLFLIAFALGMAVRFPTAAVTRAIESGINTASIFPVSLSPVHLTWTGLRSDRLTLRDGSGPGSAPVLTLTDVRVPFRPSLFRGATVHATLGQEGAVRGYLAWDGSLITVDDLSARLEDVPLPLDVPGLTVKGKVSVAGQFHPIAVRGGPRAEIPDGELHGKAEGVEIGGINVAGTKLPTAKLQQVDFSVRTGRTVQIERIDVRGDLQGTVQGSIIPNLERPQDSRLSLTIAASVRPGWMQETGTLRPILEGFFPGGRIEGALSGTTGVPNWIPGRGRR